MLPDTALLNRGCMGKWTPTCGLKLVKQFDYSLQLIQISRLTTKDKSRIAATYPLVEQARSRFSGTLLI